MILQNFIVIICALVAIRIMKKIAPENKAYPIWAIFVTIIYLIASLSLL